MSYGQLELGEAKSGDYLIEDDAKKKKKSERSKLKTPQQKLRICTRINYIYAHDCNNCMYTDALPVL